MATTIAKVISGSVDTACHIDNRSVTVAPTLEGARPRISASHAATSARTAFFDPRNTRPSWRAGSAAVAGTKTRANHTPGLRSVNVATGASVRRDR